MRTCLSRVVAVAVSLAVAGFFGASLVIAQQPERPKEHPKENPKEHPKSEGSEKVTKEQLADAIVKYVNDESAKTGGRFEVDDPVDKQTLSLELKLVHKDRLSPIGADTYFACADFVSKDGVTYDLDIFMKGPDAAHLQTTEVTIHKKNGKERYTWYEEGGVWMKKPV